MHSRLGHPSFQVLRKIKSLSPVIKSNNLTHNCSICPLAKQHTLPFPVSSSHAHHLFDLVHMDVWGPYKHPTHNQCKYFLTIVDDFSRATWTYLLSNKHNAIDQIKSVHFYVKNHFHTTIKTVRSDNGTEFFNSSLNEFFLANGISHQSSCPYTPQQNARVERKHKQLLEIARAIRFQANFPIHFRDTVFKQQLIL